MKATISKNMIKLWDIPKFTKLEIILELMGTRMEFVYLNISKRIECLGMVQTFTLQRRHMNR